MLFGYNQRAMAELLRGKPKGRKYLEEEKLHDYQSQADITLYVIPGGGSGIGSTEKGVTSRIRVDQKAHSGSRKACDGEF